MKKEFIKKASLISVFLLLGVFSTFAQSTIYLMYDVEYFAPEMPIKINGEEAFSLVGEKKVLLVYGKPIFDAPIYTKSKRKCTLNVEGKVILSFDVDVKIGNAVSLPPLNRVIPYSDEIQLNLSQGSVHYIKINPVMKGNKMVF